MEITIRDIYEKYKHRVRLTYYKNHSTTRWIHYSQLGIWWTCEEDDSKKESTWRYLYQDDSFKDAITALLKE
jgi:hypothetical protein